MKVIETTTIVLFGCGVSALTSHVQYFYRIQSKKKHTKSILSIHRLITEKLGFIVVIIRSYKMNDFAFKRNCPTKILFQ